MTLIPSQIAGRVALRIGAFQGIPATIDTSYATPFANMVSESVTPNSVRADTLFIEQEIANIVAGNQYHKWRNLISDVTAILASGSQIPSIGASGAKIIGLYGQVRDADAGTVPPNRVLEPTLHEDEIRLIAENPGIFTLDTFAYALMPPRVYHNRPAGVIIDVCVFDFDARKTAIDADAALLFQSAGNMYFYGVMSLLGNTDARLVELSNLYVPRYEAWRQSLSTMIDKVAEAAVA